MRLINRHPFETPLLLIVLAFIVGSCASQGKESNDQASIQSYVIDSTEYFVFHNNYWVNLHHYLYEKASGGQARKLAEDGNAHVDLGEAALLAELSSQKKAQLDSAVSFYRQSVIQRSMLGSSQLLYRLQELGEMPVVMDSVISDSLAYNLNAASEVYQALWPSHKEYNESIVRQHLEQVRSHEAKVMSDMARYSGDSWTYGKVRIDMTAYGDWAGAYSIAKPRPSIVISTLDPTTLTTMFVESVYHEGSHLLFSRDSPLRAKLYIRSNEIGQDFPRGLWHATLFYLCGRATQESLKMQEVDHELIMVAKEVFDRYNTPEFQADLDAYMQGEVDMDTTVDELLANVRE